MNVHHSALFRLRVSTGFLCLLAVLGVSFPSRLPASTLTWLGGNGNWTENAATNWANGAVWAPGDSAVFGATPGTVTLTDESLSAHTLIFDVDGYVITAGNPLGSYFAYQNFQFATPTTSVEFAGKITLVTPGGGAIQDGIITISGDHGVLESRSMGTTGGTQNFTGDHSSLNAYSNGIAGGTQNFTGEHSNLQAYFNGGVHAGTQNFIGGNSVLNTTGSSAITGGVQTFSGSASKLTAAWNAGVDGGTQHFAGVASSLVVTATGGLNGGTQYFEGDSSKLVVSVTEGMKGGAQIFSGSHSSLEANVTHAVAGGAITLQRDAVFNVNVANATTAGASVTFDKSLGGAGGSLLLKGGDTTVGAINSAQAGAGVIRNDSAAVATLTSAVASGTSAFSGSLQDGMSHLGFNKAGEGTLHLTGTNSYRGGTTISGGTLLIDNDASLGFASTPITFDGGTLKAAASLNVFRPATVNPGGGRYDTSGFNSAILSLAGTGTFTKAGTGSLLLLQNTAFAGSIDATEGTFELVSGKTLQLGTDNSASTLKGSFVNSGTVSLNNVDVTAAISGSGVLVKEGDGTTRLRTDNSYSGGTILKAGTLGLGGNNVFGSGTLTIQGGSLRAVDNPHSVSNSIALDGDFTLGRLTTLTGPVSLARDVTIYAANPDQSAPAISTISGNITGGHSLSIDTGVTVDSHTIVLSGNNSYSGGTNLKGGVLNVGSANALGSGNISFSGGTLQYSANNQTDYSGRFSTAPGQKYSIDTNGQHVVINALLGSAGGSLTKWGEGTLGITSYNTFSGGTELHGGTIEINNPEALGHGLIVIYGGGIRAGGNPVTLDNQFLLYGNFTVGRLTNFTGNGSVDFASATITAENADGAANADSIFSGNISGSEGIIIAQGEHGVGTGSIVFSGQNTYQGGTTLRSGRLAVSGDENLGGGATAVTFDGGTLRVANNLNSFRTLNVTANGGTLDLHGSQASFAGFSGTAGTLVQTGNSSITLNGLTEFGGTLVLSSTNFRIDSGAAFELGTGGASGSVNQEVRNFGRFTINRSDDFTFGQVISGTGSFVKKGGGTLTLSPSNSYTGGTTINGGLILLSQESQLGASGTVTLNGGGLKTAQDMNIGRSLVITSAGGTFDTNGFNSSISFLQGAGGLQKNGAGDMTFNGTGTIGGGLNIAEGRLVIPTGRSLQIGSLQVAPAAGIVTSGTLIFQNIEATSYAGSLGSLGGSIEKKGSGLLALSGNNASMGTITARGGTLEITSGLFGGGNSNLQVGVSSLDEGTFAVSGENFPSPNETVVVTGTSSIGVVAGSKGTVSLSGGLWEARVLTVGVAGSGTLRMTGGRLTSKPTTVGDLAGSQGIILVSGGTWSTEDLIVGRDGTGILTVSDAGRVNVTGVLDLGLGDGGSGTVNIGAGGAPGVLSASTINGSLFASSARVNFNHTGSLSFPGSLTGSVSVTKSGAGETQLAGLMNNYSGGTTIAAGRLSAAHSNAFGSGEITITGGTLVLGSGITAGNPIVLAGGSYERRVSGNLTNAVNATSHLGGHDTAATLLAGNAAGAVTLVTSFSATSSALNDSVRRSDVYSFAGTGADIFVLQLSFTSTAPGSYLGWLSGDHWINARNGNLGNNPAFAAQFQGSYSEFLAAHPGISLADSLGAWGVSMSGGTATTWAVLNHNSDFSIVPEPSTVALAGLGVLLLGRRPRRRCCD